MFAVIPLWAKVLAIVLALAALLGGIAHGVQQIKADGAAQAQAAQAAKAAAWAASTAIAQHEQDARQMENLNEANRFNARRDADLGGFDAQRDRLRQHLAAGGGLGTGGVATAAPSSSAGMSAPGMVSADVYLRAVDAARDLAAAVDCLTGASTLCAADYDAVTKGTPYPALTP